MGLMTDQDWTQLARFSAIDITPEQVSALYTDELIEVLGDWLSAGRSHGRTEVVGR